MPVPRPTCLNCGHTHHFEDESDMLPWGRCREATCRCNDAEYVDVVHIVVEQEPGRVWAERALCKRILKPGRVWKVVSYLHAPDLLQRPGVHASSGFRVWQPGLLVCLLCKNQYDFLRRP